MAQLEISFHNNVSCVLQCIQSQKTIDNIPCNIGEITCLFEDLSIGKINPYSYSLRKKELLCFSSPFALSKHEFNDFHKKLENADSIRVFSSFCPNEYLGLCYVCYKIYPRIRKIELCMPLDNEKYFYTMPLSVRTVEEIELLIDQTTVVSTKEYAEIFEWVLNVNFQKTGNPVNKYCNL